MPDIIRLRNISPDDLHVAPLGGRTVRRDGVIDLPRDVHERYVWPEQTWRTETNPRPVHKSEEK